MLIQEPVQAAIWHCLDHYDYFDAIFLAERLNAEVESDESTFLLATCYYRAGKPNQAYSLLRRKGCITPQCKFLLAKCCLEFENLSEAETILRGSSSGDEDVYSEQLNIDNIVAEYGEHAVFVLRLLSEICYQTERDKVANELNHNILKLNPFIWSSFEMLCNRAELSPIPVATPNSNPLQTPLNTPLSTSLPPNSNTAAPNIDSKPSSKQTPSIPSIPASVDPSKLFDINNLENFNYCQSSTNSLLNYYPPVTSALITNGLQTPQLFDPNSEPLINCTPVQLMNVMNNAHNISSGGNNVFKQQFTPDDTAQFKPMPPRVGKQYRTRSGLGSIMSPLNASFGILPLDSSNSFSDTPPLPLPYSTPSPLIINSSGNQLPSATLTDANEQKPIVKRQIMSKRSSTNPLVGNQQSPQSPLPPLPLQGQNTVRRSSRLFTISNNNYSVKENNKSPNRNNKFATPKSPSKKTKSKLSKNSSTGKQVDMANEKGGNLLGGGDRDGEGRGGNALSGMTREQLLTVQKHVAGGLLDLLKELGRAFYYFSQYECDACISILNTLPEHHLNTGYCLTLMAKAYYESSRYKEAVKCFAKVRELEPKRTQGLELYSTALWQQQQEVELSALAQDMNRIDQFCPQTWCVNGNCFSAQKEHDTAIKYFQRATQVDPSFAYAYTLLGHEYVLTEELDKAMNCYRHAVRIDPRHYNAWYGIGSIYSKQERFLLAEMHFRKALRINPNSSVLMCHIGVAQNALGKIDAALLTFNLALEKDPMNPLCKFHRASILFGTGRHQEALEELEQLKHIVPKESLVYYLAGKVHKKLGNTHLALMHFSWATDLDPKGANSQIKEAIDPAMNRSATTTVDLEEELGDTGGGSSGDADALFFSSSPHSTSRGGGVTPNSSVAGPATPHNNNNNNVTTGSNSGLSVVSRSHYRELDEDDELSSTGRAREMDDELDEDEDISGTDVLNTSRGDMTLGDSDDTL